MDAERRSTLGRAFCPHAVPYDCAACLAAPAVTETGDLVDLASPQAAEELARALLVAVPGYQRWLTNPPPTTHREAAGRVDVMETEAFVAFVHSRLILAAWQKVRGER